MQNLASPADNGTTRTMTAFRLGIASAEAIAELKTHLNALLPRIVEIAQLEGDGRTLAAARLAAQATR